MKPETIADNIGTKTSFTIELLDGQIVKKTMIEMQASIIIIPHRTLEVKKVLTDCQNLRKIIFVFIRTDLLSPTKL